MEPSSAPEEPSPEPHFQPGAGRTPFQEFALGMGIFLVVLGLFFTAQMFAFIKTVVGREPGMEGFDLRLLHDPAFQQKMEAYATNGDVVAVTALWSGIAGLLILLLFTILWKRDGFREFLGVKPPSLRATLRWLGIFILLGAMLEGLAWLSPAFRTEFMSKILGSTTDRSMMILGVGIAAPLFEEFLLRGLAYGAFRHAVDKHVAVALTAGIFTLMHLQYEVMVMLLILPIGVVLGYARANTGSIWVPVLLHVINNLYSVLGPQVH